MALIDSMNFDELMAFEDKHSISLGGVAHHGEGPSSPQARRAGGPARTRIGRNPITGEMVKVPARKRIAFRKAPKR